MAKKILKMILKYPIKWANWIFTFFYYKFHEKNIYNVDEMFHDKGENVLIFAPHVDDETIGAGATLIKHKNNGDVINCAFVTDGGGSTGDLQRKDLIKKRKEEGEKIKEIIGFKKIYFIDEMDGYVDSRKDELINKIYDIIQEVNPDIIYTPFLVDGHNDHVETTKSLIKALDKWDNKVSIYMYEVNCPILPKIINSVSIMDKNLYIEKKELFREFESQKVMGFNAFLLLNRMKRLIVERGYAAETFVRIDLDDLKRINEELIRQEFSTNGFRQLSSEYNLLLTFNNNKELNKRYSSVFSKLSKAGLENK